MLYSNIFKEMDQLTPLEELMLKNLLGHLNNNQDDNKKLHEIELSDKSLIKLFRDLTNNTDEEDFDKKDEENTEYTSKNNSSYDKSILEVFGYMNYEQYAVSEDSGLKIYREAEGLVYEDGSLVEMSNELLKQRFSIQDIEKEPEEYRIYLKHNEVLDAYLNGQEVYAEMAGSAYRFSKHSEEYDLTSLSFQTIFELITKGLWYRMK